MTNQELIENSRYMLWLEGKKQYLILYLGKSFDQTINDEVHFFGERQKGNLLGIIEAPSSSFIFVGNNIVIPDGDYTSYNSHSHIGTKKKPNYTELDVMLRKYGI